MNEAWLDPIRWSWLPGTLLGLVGGTLGPLMGILAPRGRGRGVILGLMLGVGVACAGLLAAGMTAWIVGQPYGVWYGLGLPGLLGCILMGGLYPVGRRAYGQAEERRMRAQDARLGGDERAGGWDR